MISIIVKLEFPSLEIFTTDQNQNQNQRFFASFGAELWNSISVETRKLRKHAFKIQIKRTLLSHICG